MTDLFAAAGLETGAPRPLADRLRPKRLSEVVGQDELVGPDGTLTRLLKSGRIQSIVFWGPPGSGKTTIARLLANETKLEFEQLSAIFSGVQDLRKAFDRARARRQVGKGTLLFIDEIHRFNRAQQDSFLPHMEDGTITLVGATTENPSFELNAALLSRAAVLTLNRLETRAHRATSAAGGSPGRASVAARRGCARCVQGDGGRGWPRGAEHGRGGVCVGADWQQAADARGTDEPRAAARAALRQEPRRALQPDQRPAQGGARLRSRCGAVLAVPHARWRRGSAVSGAAARAHGRRGHRPRRSASDHAGAGGEGYV